MRGVGGWRAVPRARCHRGSRAGRPRGSGRHCDRWGARVRERVRERERERECVGVTEVRERERE